MATIADKAGHRGEAEFTYIYARKTGKCRRKDTQI